MSSVISRHVERDTDGNVTARRTITRQTYAVPTRHVGTALDMVTRDVAMHLPHGTTFCSNAVAAGPEVHVIVVGDERAHSAMLAHFAWVGW